MTGRKPCLRRVRFGSIFGLPLSAKTGLMHCDKRILFDHCVGTAERWPR